jgi:K(+)-stimulated pyrophosphate-energized sodium pump
MGSVAELLSGLAPLFGAMGLFYGWMVYQSIAEIRLGHPRLLDAAAAMDDAATAELWAPRRHLAALLLVLALGLAAGPGLPSAAALVLGALGTVVAARLGLRAALRATARAAHFAREKDGYRLRAVLVAAASVTGLGVAAVPLLGIGSVLLAGAVIGENAAFVEAGGVRRLVELALALSLGAAACASMLGLGTGGRASAAGAGAGHESWRTEAMASAVSLATSVPRLGSALLAALAAAVAAAMSLAAAAGSDGDADARVRLLAVPMGLVMAGQAAAILASRLPGSTAQATAPGAERRSLLRALLLYAAAAAAAVLLALVPWRAAAAHLTGVLAVGGAAVLLEVGTAIPYRPVQRIAEAARAGAGRCAAAALGVGMLGALGPLGLVALAVLAGWAAGAQLGAALAGLGIVASAGLAAAAAAYRPTALSCALLSRQCFGEAETGEQTAAALRAGRSAASVGRGLRGLILAAAALCVLMALSESAGVSAAFEPAPALSGALLGGVLLLSAAALSMGAAERAARPGPGWRIGAVGLMLGSAAFAAVLGPSVLAGLLVGAALVGSTVALVATIAGEALGSARQYIEDGYGGGEGSASHTALLEAERLGERLREEAAPALELLLLVLLTAALTLAPWLLAARA